MKDEPVIWKRIMRLLAGLNQDGTPAVNIRKAVNRVCWDDDYRRHICAWLEANDIRPGDIPYHARGIFGDGQLTVPMYVKGRDGHHIIDPYDDTRVLTEVATFTITVEPDDTVQSWLA